MKVDDLSKMTHNAIYWSFGRKMILIYELFVERVWRGYLDIKRIFFSFFLLMKESRSLSIGFKIKKRSFLKMKGDFYYFF